MDLMEELDQLRSRMSWFRKVALHVHSPASYDWAKDSKDPRDSKDALLKDPSPYLQCLDKTYDLVAITDHMRASFACDHCRKTKQCVILPGMELNVRFTTPFQSPVIHFLAIFPGRTSTEKMRAIFAGHGDMPDDKDRTGKEVLKVSALKELVERVQDVGGILIAAHVDNGYRSTFRDQGDGALRLVRDDEEELNAKATEFCDHYKEELVRAGVHAVEIKKPPDSEHYRFVMGQNRVEVATLLRNDAQSLDELEKGACTYVKMSDVSLEGLRLALSFPDTRVRHSLSEAPAPVLEGMRIADSEGCFADTTLAFSPNLTCIIGARGTGKSALVDAIRYAFGYNRGMGKDIEDLADRVRGRQEETLEGSTIEILYRTTAGERYRFESDYSPKDKNKDEYATEVYDEHNSKQEIPDVETYPSFPCRLFGWSEIEKLGREPVRQRKLLDLLLNLHDLLAERDATRGGLGADRSAIRGMAEDLETYHKRSRELPHLLHLTEEHKFLRRPEINELFENEEAEASNSAEAKEWASDVSRWLEEVQLIVDQLPRPELTGDVDKAWKEATGQKALSDLEQAAKQLISAGRRLVEKATRLSQVFATRHKNAAAEMQRKLPESGVEKLGQKRARVGDQLRKAQEQSREYNKKLTALTKAIDARAKNVARLRAILARMSEKRQEGASRVTEKLGGSVSPRIAVTVEAHSDAESYESWLQKTLSDTRIHHTRRKPITDALHNAYEPEKVVQAALKDGLSKCELPPDRKDDLSEALVPFRTDEGSGLRRVRPETLDTLLQCDEAFVDDSVEVTLEGKPISRLSPGQVCSALLPIILTGSTDPLILDQPEDNLDNQLVTDRLIRMLQELKLQRQIIVVTHNPNIVVNGDAEQVIVMRSENGTCSCGKQASIDDEDVMGSIVALMEGGREALINRYRRYRPHVQLPDVLRP